MSEFEELAKIIQKKGKVCLAKNTKYYRLKISNKRFLVYDTSVGLMALWEGDGLYDFSTGFGGKIVNFIGFNDCVDCDNQILTELLNEIRR